MSSSLVWKITYYTLGSWPSHSQKLEGTMGTYNRARLCTILTVSAMATYPSFSLGVKIKQCHTMGLFFSCHVPGYMGESGVLFCKRNTPGKAPPLIFDFSMYPRLSLHENKEKEKLSVGFSRYASLGNICKIMIWDQSMSVCNVFFLSFYTIEFFFKGDQGKVNEPDTEPPNSKLKPKPPHNAELNPPCCWSIGARLIPQLLKYRFIVMKMMVYLRRSARVDDRKSNSQAAHQFVTQISMTWNPSIQHRLSAP